MLASTRNRLIGFWFRRPLGFRWRPIFLWAKMVHVAKKALMPRTYNQDNSDFDWLSELGPKAFRPVDYRTLPEACTQEQHFEWMVRNGLLPSPLHKLAAARQMGVDMAKVDWAAVDASEKRDKRC